MLKGIPALTHVIHVTQIVLLEVVDHQHHHAMHVAQAVQITAQMVRLVHLICFVYHAPVHALVNVLVRAQEHVTPHAVDARGALVNAKKTVLADVKVNV